MALRIALDANRYVDFCRGDEGAVDVMRKATTIAVPFIVLAELRAGFRVGSRAKDNQRVLARFLQSARVSVVFADDGTIDCYATLYADLRRAGTPIPSNDLWIAALVVQHNLTLLTRDKHFEQVTRVPRI